MGSDVAEQPDYEVYEEYEEASEQAEQAQPAPSQPPDEPAAELVLTRGWMLVLTGFVVAAGLVTASLYLGEQAALRGARPTTQSPSSPPPPTSAPARR